MGECNYSGCGHEDKIDGLCAKHHAMQEKAIGNTVRSEEASCSKCGKKASEVKRFIKKRGLCESCAYYKTKLADKKRENKQKPTIAKQPKELATTSFPLPNYTKGKIEDFIADQEMGYLDGNIIMYVTRYRHEGTPGADLKKARWYLDKLIEKECGGS